MAAKKKGKGGRKRRGKRPVVERPYEHVVAERHRRLRTIQGHGRKFLHEFGAGAEDIPGGLLVDGEPFLFSAREVDDAQPLAAIDRLVAERFADRLAARAADELAGLPYATRQSQGGVVVCEDDRSVAVVTATRAVISSGRRRVRGNFLTAGEHWEGVRAALGHPTRHSDSTPAAPPGRRVLLKELPGQTAERLADAELASDRIRTERVLDFGHPVVVLFADDAQLRFELIDSGPPVALPFTYRDGDEQLRACLRLKTPAGPLALGVEAEDAQRSALIAAAWLRALLAYADLTCRRASRVDAERAREPGERPRRGATSTQSAQRRALVLSGNSGAPVWERLAPTSRTHSLLSSYVAGHRRVLPAGRKPSAEAVAYAQRIGVQLPAGQTWVRPHARGLPNDTELVFRWEPASS
jgi:hypothetical protein